MRPRYPQSGSSENFNFLLYKINLTIYLALKLVKFIALSSSSSFFLIRNSIILMLQPIVFANMLGSSFVSVTQYNPPSSSSRNVQPSDSKSSLRAYYILLCCKILAKAMVPYIYVFSFRGICFPSLSFHTEENPQSKNLTFNLSAAILMLSGLTSLCIQPSS